MSSKKGVNFKIFCKKLTLKSIKNYIKKRQKNRVKKLAKIEQKLGEFCQNKRIFLLSIIYNKVDTNINFVYNR